MRYYGGKSKIAKALAEALPQKAFGVYWEPFCGACNVITRVEAPLRVASDAHPDLILLWQALQDGWIPPDNISEDEYRDLKGRTAPSALRAFVGFGCSFGGKWFAGYARNKGKWNYAGFAKRSLAKKLTKLQDVRFLHLPYQEMDTSFLLESPALVYCDPPYSASTSDYKGGRFDTVAFWEWVRDISQVAAVYVSEYEAPDDFTESWSKPVKTQMHGKCTPVTGKNLTRVEKLFHYEGD